MNYKNGKFIILIILTMTAFASNSLLARIAIANQEIGPASFSFIRLLSGAIMLLIIVFFRSGIISILKLKPNLNGVLGLSFYMVGFHYAYSSLEAGIGSIILFGGVQLVMFSSATFSTEKPTFFNWLGMFIAMFGISLLFFPKEFLYQPTSGLIFMLVASIGWGIYSISGKEAKNPITSTLSNFLFAIPIISLILILYPDNVKLSMSGIFLAISSGVIMSALGYSLWYAILPLLKKTIAAIIQLMVPVLALIISMLFLGERLTYLSLLSSILIIGGVLVGILSDYLTQRLKL